MWQPVGLSHAAHAFFGSVMPWYFAEFHSIFLLDFVNNKFTILSAYFKQAAAHFFLGKCAAGYIVRLLSFVGFDLRRGEVGDEVSVFVDFCLCHLVIDFG